MEDVVFTFCPSNQLTAVQSSMVSNSDHSWTLSKNIQNNNKEGEALWLRFKLKISQQIAANHLESSGTVQNFLLLSH